MPTEEKKEAVRDELEQEFLRRKVTFEDLLMVREEPIPFDELTKKLTGKKKFMLTATDLCRVTVQKNRNMFKKKGSKPSPLAALAAIIA
jgi:hypothetical protein